MDPLFFHHYPPTPETWMTVPWTSWDVFVIVWAAVALALLVALILLTGTNKESQ